MNLPVIPTTLTDPKASEPIVKKRILIVDDEPGFTHVVRRALESTGLFEVMEENHSYEAIATVRKFMPDLILLDVIMPVVDGGDIAARLHSNSALRSIPIIFLTATVSAREAGAQGLNSGGSLFLAKPVDLDSLSKHINDILNRPQP